SVSDRNRRSRNLCWSGKTAICIDSSLESCESLPGLGAGAMTGIRLFPWVLLGKYDTKSLSKMATGGALSTMDLIELFARELDVDPSKLDDMSSPETIEEWDSTAAMFLVVAIEETFNVQLSTPEIVKMRTIGLARKILQGKGVVA